MSSVALSEKFTLSNLRAARDAGRKVPMLTCYDYTTAGFMQQAGVPALLVGDSAANVILGYPTTLPVSLDFMIEITTAVRRGAPLAFLVADMPFGSYQASTAQGVKAVSRMVKRSGCDCVKIEAGPTQLKLVRALSDMGVAVMPHLGLRPQAVGVLGYRYQGRTFSEAREIVALALQMQAAGAAAILIEAVPPEVAAAVVAMTNVPIIGCGAGPACHGCVIVTQDALGLTQRPPRFVPQLASLAAPLRDAFAKYVGDVVGGVYPAPQHAYAMADHDVPKLMAWVKEQTSH